MKQTGFGAIELLLVFAGAILLCFGGWSIWRAKHDAANGLSTVIVTVIERGTNKPVANKVIEFSSTNGTFCTVGNGGLDGASCRNDPLMWHTATNSAGRFSLPVQYMQQTNEIDEEQGYDSGAKAIAYNPIAHFNQQGVSETNDPVYVKLSYGK